jgi:hypothetical protein
MWVLVSFVELLAFKSQAFSNKKGEQIIKLNFKPLIITKYNYFNFLETEY